MTARRTPVLRPRGGPGAALDATVTDLAQLCSRSAAWYALRNVEGMPRPRHRPSAARYADQAIPETFPPGEGMPLLSHHEEAPR